MRVLSRLKERRSSKLMACLITYRRALSILCVFLIFYAASTRIFYLESKISKNLQDFNKQSKVLKDTQKELQEKNSRNKELESLLDKIRDTTSKENSIKSSKIQELEFDLSSTSLVENDLFGKVVYYTGYTHTDNDYCYEVTIGKSIRQYEGSSICDSHEAASTASESYEIGNYNTEKSTNGEQVYSEGAYCSRRKPNRSATLIFIEDNNVPPGSIDVSISETDICIYRIELRLSPVTDNFIIVQNGTVLNKEAAAEIELPIETVENCHEMDEGHTEERFVKEGACYSTETFQKAIVDLMFTFFDQLHQHNITYSLFAGSLLGAIRDGKAIPYDVDGDVIVPSESLQQICETNFDLPSNQRYIFEVYECEHKPAGGRDENIPARMIDTILGIYVDIFEITDLKFVGNKKQSETHLSIMPCACLANCIKCPVVTFNKKLGKHFSVPKEWIFPLQICLFEGRETFCPRNSGKILRYYFGTSFMTPDRPKLLHNEVYVRRQRNVLQ